MTGTEAGPRAETRAEQRVSLRTLWRVGPLAIVIAIVGNLLLWLLAEALFPIPAEFMPLDPVPIIMFTVLGVGAATLVFALLARFTRRPITIFRWVALVVLLLSLVPNVQFLLDSSGATGVPFPASAMSVPGMWTLILMHVLSAAVAVWALTTLTREPAEHVEPAGPAA
ncbi:MAG TPA: DUF6069 family protein [Chloroflexota bacterium]|nr:DUF6069 family protein [Chloroflexota bacterium]